MLLIILGCLMVYLMLGALLLAFLEINISFDKLAQDVLDSTPGATISRQCIVMILRMLAIVGWPFFLYVLVFSPHD